MATAQATVVIPRPISVVWDYCSDPDNLAVYLPGVLEAKAITDGPLDIGTRWQGRTRFLGPTLSWQGEFTKVDLNSVLVMESREASFAFTSTTTVDEADDGTRLSYRMDTEPGLGGVFGKLAEPVVVRAYTRALRSSLENLVDVLS